jgi:DNA-binding NarL/FixJ family response regulator
MTSNLQSALQTVRLMLVDDHPLVRDGLRARLSAVPGLHVVAEAADADAALVTAQQVRPDLVLMDIGLPGSNGIEATRRLRERMPDLHVIILTMHDAPPTRRAAAEAGAEGYLLKDCPADQIVEAIRAVMAGEDLMPPDTQAPHLTPREQDVLRLIAQGLPSKDIGERLGMGLRTVETHRTHLRRKLDLHSAAALVRYAIEHHGR